MCIPNEFVSSYHAELVLLDNGDIFLTDCGSKNGTFLNGKRISPNVEVPVRRGDKIEFDTVPLNWGSVPTIPLRCMYQDEEGYWHVWVLSNFVDGVTIDKYVKSLGDNIDLVQVVSSLMGNVMNALDYLHSKGVIHRDIKPSNIMVDKQGRVKLMDLGIARVTSANAYTSTGFVGTPLYASPEQIMRDKMQVQATPASDIYSLGMTFYVLLNGNHPFDADTEAQILVNQVTKKLPVAKPLEKKYRKLMSVLWKATDKDPSCRYQKALDFKYAMEKALEPDPIPWWYWVLGVVGLTLVVALILFITL